MSREGSHRGPMKLGIMWDNGVGESGGLEVLAVTTCNICHREYLLVNSAKTKKLDLGRGALCLQESFHRNWSFSLDKENLCRLSF